MDGVKCFRENLRYTTRIKKVFYLKFNLYCWNHNRKKTSYYTENNSDTNLKQIMGE